MREQVPLERLNVLPEGILPVDKIALVVHPNVRQHHRDQREYRIFAAGAREIRGSGSDEVVIEAPTPQNVENCTLCSYR